MQKQTMLNCTLYRKRYVTINGKKYAVIGVRSDGTLVTKYNYRKA